VGDLGCVLISPCCSPTIRKRIPGPGFTRVTAPNRFRVWAASGVVLLQAVDGSQKSGISPAEYARQSHPGTGINICTIRMKAAPLDRMSSPRGLSAHRGYPMRSSQHADMSPRCHEFTLS